MSASWQNDYIAALEERAKSSEQDNKALTTELWEALERHRKDAEEISGLRVRIAILEGAANQAPGESTCLL